MSGNKDKTITDDGPKKPERKRRRLILIWALCIAAALILGVMGWWTMLRMPGSSYRGRLPAADDELIALADELRRDVTRLAVQIGERNLLNRPQALAQAADYIEAQFAAAGYEVKRQVYQVSGESCCNLEVEIPGTTHPEEIVIVGAHYDSVSGTPGANDNGSGVAALLALARRFSGQKTGRTLRFVAFTNEEPPYFGTDKMGSRVSARRCRERGEDIKAMLSLETIGYYADGAGSQHYPPPLGLFYPSKGNFIAVVGNVRSRRLVRRVVETFRQQERFPCEGGALPGILPGISLSDHWSFWREGYRAVMVTDTAMFRYPHYHDPEDTVDKIDFDRTARVVRGLGKVIGVLVR